MAGFEAATTLDARGDGRYGVRPRPEWQMARQAQRRLPDCAGRPARAGRAGRGLPRTRWSRSAHYLAAPEVGPADLTVHVLRRGRRTAQTRVSLATSAGRAWRALVTCGQLDPGGAVLRRRAGAAAASRGRLSPAARRRSRVHGALLAVVTERLDPRPPWAGRSGTRQVDGELRGYLRFDDGHEPDPVALLHGVVARSPPGDVRPRCDRVGCRPSGSPCHVRATPAPGPLVVRQRARLVSGGRVDEECNIWDTTGRLVATGRQLAGVRHP